MTSVIYARVSPTKHIKTDSDLHASIEESIIVCRRDAEHEDNEVIKEYIDQYVSAKSSKHMTAFNQMLDDARNHKFDRIYCRRVNRFGRNRADMIRAEIELTELGISIKFVENGIDTGKPFGKSIMAILAELAEQDRLEILKNIERGKERAILNGVKFGPKKKEFDVNSIRHLRLLPLTNRPSWKKLEQDYRISRVTMISRLKEYGFWDDINGTVK